MQSIPHPPEDMAFKQWRHPKKTFDSSISSQESFNSPEYRIQQEVVNPLYHEEKKFLKVKQGQLQNLKNLPKK